MSGGRRFPRQGEAAIGALLVEPTIEEAAKSIGVGEATLRRWLKRDDFTLAYRAARRQALEQVIARLQVVSSKAVDTLESALEADSEGVRVRAALAILEYAHKGIELIDLEERLAALEARIASQGSNARKSL